MKIEDFVQVEYPEESNVDARVCGIYKIVKYFHGNNEWFAYFKPDTWENWGNSCEAMKTWNGDHTDTYLFSISYNTIEEAVEACNRHRLIFGEKPYYTNRIVY